MINIRRIQPEDVTSAKRVIYRVAHQLFHDTRSLEESIAVLEAERRLHDMDDFQRTYFDQYGIFLVITDQERVVGTGAIRRIDDKTCELKRLWLLFEYHGQGLGYRMMQELLAFARQQGYARIRLETDRNDQSRAYNFYKRLGFYDIPRYGDHEDDVAMEMIL
ncbi:MAG TPA: GNAT family N-acetyltransferase [Anaerolineales bacterium]|nr:GNAT family N-acetyltransferase [Anaerolineales bacterium]